MSLSLTRKQRDVLETVAWGTENFGALVTGRNTPVSVVRALVRKGLVKDAGMVAVCDGDGFTIQPERYRQGWAVTEAGAAALKESGE